jgi:predicted PurR-regulated permease PerM
LAIAALILGIVGAALSLIPVLGPFLCWLPALLAIVFGFIGLSTASRLNGLRRIEALWGTILGFAPIPITIGWILVLAAFRTVSVNTYGS